MTATRSSRYSGVAITLHWVMAGLILFMIWLGHNMEGHESRYQLHKSIGITLLVLTIARIVWRLYNKPPPLPDDVKPIESKLSKLIQFGFYALMLMIPLGGWIMVSVSPFAVPTVLFETISWPSLPLGRDEGTYNLLAFLHGKGATIGFLGLLLLHVAGAVKHEIGHESGVLKRILPGRKAQAPEATKGIVVTLLASLGFFAAVSAIPFFSQIGGASLGSAWSAKDVRPNWTVVDDYKSITFDFSHDGNNYSGVFKNWDAKIEFYENDLANSKVFVEVDLTSSHTGTKLYDDSLRSKEWYDLKTASIATVKLSDFKPTETGYRAEAALTLKGITVKVPFDFDLRMMGDVATLNGTATLTRKNLDLGQESDPKAEWVSEEIAVKVFFTAEKVN